MNYDNTGWYRIDKGNGIAAPCSDTVAAMAARSAYDDVETVLHAGRFQTTFAIYSLAEFLTKDEANSLPSEERLS